MKSTPVSNDPNAVVVDEDMGIVEGFEGTKAVILVKVADHKGVVLVVVKMVLLMSMTKPPSLPWLK